MTNIPALFEDSDLSGLPTSDPGGGKAWKYAGATGFQLVVGDFTAASGVTDHGLLTGLADDDHTQYYNAARLATALSSYATTSAVAAAYQPLDSDLTAIAALSTTSFGRSLLTQADAAAARSTLGVTAGVTDHGALTGLADDDHTQYLLVNGTRALTGNIVTKQIVIDAKDGVDLKLGATGGGIYGFGIGNYQDTFLAFYVGNDGFSYSAAGANMPIGKGYNFINSGSSIDSVNTSIRLASSGCLEINNGTPGQSRDLMLRDLYVYQYVRAESGLLVVKNDLSAYTPVFCSNATLTGLLFVGSYTVATLPSASANAGAESRVTDSSVTTHGSTVSGGGSNRVKVFSNGTNWLVN